MRCGAKIDYGPQSVTSVSAGTFQAFSTVSQNAAQNTDGSVKAAYYLPEKEKSTENPTRTTFQKDRNVRNIKCTNCGSSLVIVDSNREFAFCEYCGAKLLLDDYRVREHYVDEAAVKRVELEEKVKLKELELEQQHHARYAKIRKTVAIVWAFFVLALIIFGLVLWFSYDDGLLRTNIVLWGLIIVGMVIGGGITLIFHTIPDKENDLTYLRNGGIRFPDVSILQGKCEVAKRTLEQLGFMNVQTVNMHDLIFAFGITINGESYKAGEGDISSITVNGRPVRFGGVYMPGDSIIINYHGKG